MANGNPESTLLDRLPDYLAVADAKGGDYIDDLHRMMHSVDPGLTIDVLIERYRSRLWFAGASRELPKPPSSDERLVNTARKMTANKAHGNKDQTVSGFCEWVYRLYRPLLHARDERMAQGKRAEERIRPRRMGAFDMEGWDLVYDGMDDETEALCITSLAINRKPIYGKPDLVFREYATGRIVIVEVKATDAPIYRNGWPNLRAQLWAYAQADRWCDAPSIRLVGEVWNSTPKAVPRQVFSWDSTDEPVSDFPARLFSFYREKKESPRRPDHFLAPLMGSEW